MATLIFNSTAYGQRPVSEASNLSKIMQKVKMEENDKYTINEAILLRREAGVLLSDAQKMTAEWLELKKISQLSQRFEDLNKPAEKKAEKTGCKILILQTDALELYELYNDIVYAFYSNQYKRIFPDVSKNTIKESNAGMNEAEFFWQSAKELRDKGYKTGLCRNSIDILIKAQKMEEEAIALQEEALSKLMDFQVSESVKINYALFDMPGELKPVENTKEDLLYADASDLGMAGNQYSLKTESRVGNNEAVKEAKSKQITYKIQIGAFMGKANEAAFRGITPITTEKSDSGFTRYLAGEYNSYEVVKHALDILQNTGFRDAFIVTYTDNLRLGPGVKISGGVYAKASHYKF